MNRKELHATAHQVIDALTDTEPGADRAIDPTAWRKTVRNRIRSQHWTDVLAALEAGEQPDELAASIRASIPTPAPPTTIDDGQAMRAARAIEWAENARRLNEALDTPADPDLAKERLGAIRCDLGAVHFRKPDEIPNTTHWRRFEDLIRGRADSDIDQALDQLEHILDPEGATP